MQVQVERLEERLAKRLDALYFISGEEPLQLAEASAAVRRHARAGGVAERLVFDAELGIDWQALAGEANALSLFASRRLIEIRLGERKPDKAGQAGLAQLAERPPADDVVLVTAGKLDGATRKSAWCKALEARAVCVVGRDLRGRALLDWLARRAARHGKRLVPDAAELIADRVEGNMLGAAQEIEKLCLLVDEPAIDTAAVLASVVDNTRYDVFQFVDAVVAGDSARALRIARGLREEGSEPLLLNWALGRELRQLVAMAGHVARGVAVDAVLEQYRVWTTRRASTQRMLEHHREAELLEFLLHTNVIDTVVKGARPGNAWDEIELFCVQVAGGGATRRGAGQSANLSAL